MSAINHPNIVRTYKVGLAARVRAPLNKAQEKSKNAGSAWTTQGAPDARCRLLQVTSHSGEHLDPGLLSMERQLLAGAGGGDPEVGDTATISHGGRVAMHDSLTGLARRCKRGG